MNGKLNEKVAVVTGGSSGIGLAIARRFVAEGATVFVTGRRQAALDAAVKAIGPQATGVCGDSARLADLDRLYGVVRDKAGRVDIVVANAGFGEAAPLGAIDEEHLEKSFIANVKGTLYAAQKALPLLQDEGTIILLGSISTVRAVPGFSAYAASKAAIRSFARQWMLELAPRRIRVNVISPGPIDTPGLDSSGRHRRAAATVQGSSRRPGATRPSRRPGRDRQGRGILGFRRCQLHQWRRTLRRWWLGAGLIAVRRAPRG